MPTGVVRSFYQDPFSPTLFNSPALVVTQEQDLYIKEVLEKSCSDSQFADKAYRALHKILTVGSVKVPTVTSLTPNSVEIGDPSFTVHVHGANYKSGDKIIFAGVEEPTTFVSATELTTGVNMTLWVGPDAVPVTVQSVEGVLSNQMMFTFVDNIPAATVAATSAPKTTPTPPTMHKPFIPPTGHVEKK